MFLSKVIKAFQKNQIPYALAGGYAVSLHGAVRGTVDIDFLVPLNEEVLVKIEEVMKSLGLVSRIPVNASDIARFRDEYIKNKNVKVWTFVNPNLPIEIVDIMILYDLKDFTTITKKTVFGDINVVSKADLIRMKREAGRPQDLADIEALERIKDDSHE